MEGRFLTPLQLWQDFSPTRQPLDVNYVESVSVEGISFKTLFFNAFSDEGGKVRTLARLFLPDPKGKKMIIFVPDFGDDPYETALSIAKMGYNVGYVDLTGEGGLSTEYSGSYAFGKLSEAKKNLHNCMPSAKASPVFLWTRMLSRFVTLLMDLFPKCKPIVMGARQANEIVWPLCAMDDRLYGGVSVLGWGMQVHRDNLPLEEDENQHKWEIALSPQAYAKYTVCPMLIVTATNHASHTFDKLDHMVSLLPEASMCATVVSNRLNHQISGSSYFTLWRWIEGRYSAKKELPKNPELTYTVDEGGIQFAVTPDQSDKKAASVFLFYTFDEDDPEYRSWQSMNAKAEEEDTRFTVRIAPCDRELTAYACVRYRDGVEIASTPLTIALTPDMPRKRLTPSKLLFDTSMDITFFAETRSVVLPDDDFQVARCPQGIQGIMAKDGALISYCVGEKRRIAAAGALQIWAYTDQEREFSIRMTVLRDGVYRTYTAKQYLPDSAEWQRFELDPEDFRDQDRLPMGDWSGMKRIKIEQAEGILFNNMLWV